MCAGRTRSGFTSASREQLVRRFQPLAAAECPFANLPESKAGRWGEGLTAEKMKECRWLKPALVGQFEFVEWTPDGHLRHSRYMGLREDMKPWDVVRSPINPGRVIRRFHVISAQMRRARGRVIVRVDWVRGGGLRFDRVCGRGAIRRGPDCGCGLGGTSGTAGWRDGPWIRRAGRQSSAA